MSNAWGSNGVAQESGELGCSANGFENGLFSRAWREGASKSSKMSIRTQSIVPGADNA